ncbi:helicase associated domain-containing protein [Streptomyces diacarni]|uniref:helicase associated domain-containing protein n=1 Tax=Streptomyces diacarni TaxID=2800381 RepID=UPI002697FFAC
MGGVLAEGRGTRFPLGTWVAEQRRAFGAGQMAGRRAARLDKLGMVWSAADVRFQENLAAARAYYERRWTLCAPRSAAALDKLAPRARDLDAGTALGPQQRGPTDRLGG